MKPTLILLIAILALLAAPVAARANSENTAWLSADTQTEIAVVSLNASLAQPTQGFEFTLTYNPDCLSLQKHEAGSLIVGKPQWIDTPKEKGSLASAYAIRGDPPITGSGELVAITFTVNGNCVASVTLETIRLFVLDDDGIAQPVEDVVIETPLAQIGLAGGEAVIPDASATSQSPALTAEPMPTDIVSPTTEPVPTDAEGADPAVEPTLVPEQTIEPTIFATLTAGPTFTPTPLAAFTPQPTVQSTTVPPGSGPDSNFLILAGSIVLSALLLGGLIAASLLLHRHTSSPTHTQPRYPDHPSAPRLIVENGEKRGYVAPLHSAEFNIGRGEASDLCLPHRSISRAHALILCRDGFYYLADADSRNGTYLNGKAVGNHYVPLRDGDQIRLGKSFSLRFRTPRYAACPVGETVSQ